jgi:hypothetical protein
MGDIALVKVNGPQLKRSANFKAGWFVATYHPPFEAKAFEKLPIMISTLPTPYFALLKSLFQSVQSTLNHVPYQLIKLPYTYYITLAKLRRVMPGYV